MEEKALGLIETKGLVGAIEAADAMVKAAKVKLIGTEQTLAALITVKVKGEVGAVKAAVEAGSRAAEKIGVLVSSHIIPRPHDETKFILYEEDDNQKSYKTGGQVRGLKDVENIPVRQLRRLARDFPDFPIHGREISKANKKLLIEKFKELLEKS